jgi:hypothetical protein
MDFTPIGSSIPAIVHSGNAGTPANFNNLGLTSANGTLFCNTGNIAGACFSVPKGQNGQGLSWASILANPGVKNERNPWADGNARPRLQTNAATITLDQNLTNDLFGLGPVALFADAFYSNQRGKQVYIPGNGQARAVLQRNLAVPTINPYYPTGTKCVTNPSANSGGNPANCVPTNLRVDYSFALEVPTFITGGEVARHWDAGFNLDKLPFDWFGSSPIHERRPQLRRRHQQHQPEQSLRLPWAIS